MREEKNKTSNTQAVFDEKRRLKDSKVIIPKESSVKEAKEYVEENAK